MLPFEFRFKALDAFPHLRRVILDEATTPRVFLPYVARFERKAKDVKARRNLFAFAEWCVRRDEPDVREAARTMFYAPLFDERYGDWSEVVAWLSPFVVELNWQLWEARLTEAEMVRLRELLTNRTEVRYVRATIATQTTECTFPRSPPLPDITIRLSMHLEIPSPTGPGIGIGPSTTDVLPEEWDFEVFEYIIEAVHAGLHAVEHPLPDEGMDFIVTSLSLHPRIGATTSEDDVRRAFELVYSVTRGLVVSLLGGMVASRLPPVQEATGHLPSLWVRAQETRKLIGGR